MITTSSSGGWENQTPSRSPLFEVVVLLATFDLAQECSAIVHGDSGFAEYIYQQMDAFGKDTKRYRVEGDNDVHSELHTASEAELEKSLNDMRGTRDWADIVRETNTNMTSSSSCLIDSLSTESCMERAEGTVCIFPKVIVKQVSNEKDYAREKAMHRELSDTRYFPQLYEFGQEDQSCRTLFIENVGDHQNHPNVWTSNYTYYSTFIDNAFSIFEEKRIIPFDLNVCCNIVVNGSKIRIIDFGKYQFEKKKNKRRHVESEKIRLELLEGLTNEIKQHQDKSVFQSGDRVRARYKGKGKRWYKGTIVGVLDDSTYDIDYDDGDSDRALSVKFIRSLRKK